MSFPVLQASLQGDLSGSLSGNALTALKAAQNLQRSSNSSSTSDTDLPVVGGILRDGLHSWLARGPAFILILSKTNTVVSIFNFNRIFADLRFVVTSCCSCKKLLIIGLKGQDGRGCVVVYNPLLSKLVSAIDVLYPVSALEVVSSCGGAVASSHCLHKSLRWLFGIVAVGTEEGHLYLLDLRFDGSSGPGSLPSQAEIVSPSLRNVPKKRENVVQDDSFLAFEMQAACHEEGVFHYAKPDDEIIESFYPCDAIVTSLLYEPRATCLFVGFSFGHFQIFSLNDLSLVHSSDAQEDLAPVLRFSFQEPENDPRKFCYLWVARGHKPGIVSHQGNSEPLTVAMFQLAFMKKEILSKTKPRNGTEKEKACATVLYKNLELCCLRFEHTLGTGLVSSMSKCHGSTLLMCSSVEKYAFESEHQEPTDEDIEYCTSPSTSFCMFGWQSPNLGKHRGRSQLNVLVFDINRWYMAQMPHGFRGDTDDFIYVGFWSFDDDKNSLAEDETILGMCISDKIQHFVSGMRPLPERYFLPSSCTFSLHYITNQSLNHYELCGYQKQVLNTVSELKSMCLVNPKEIHNNIISAELFSKHTTNQAFTPDMMRENILTTALEHGQVSFLLSVVGDLASGHLAACGCTLRFVMDWAWKSVAHVKDLIDGLCVPIFDCTCDVLDALVQSQLQFYTTQIHHMKIVFQKLMEYTEDASDQSKDELNAKLNVVTLIYQYLKVVQWFISNGLLPEQLDNIESDQEIMTPSGILIYKYSRLRQVFDQRRSELKRSNSPDLLIIDGWVEEIGEPLTSRWLKEEGGKTTYPPPSFMTLLDMYYLDCFNVVTKHCLVMYLLFDVLAMFSTLDSATKDANAELYESQRDRLNNIASFLHMFAVPTGLIKLTQGFWLLDHKNFEDALNVFLDADTSKPTSSWQERRILRAFLHQGHPTMALKFLSACHPRVETITDAKMHITIYVKSSEPLKAWNLVQMMAGQHDMSELFSHLFLLCQEYSQLDQLLKLPFTAREEEMVVKYLRESNSAEATQILVLFYLQHSKYVEAIKLHSQNKHIRLMRDQSEESRRRNAKLDHIVQSYSNLLPKIEREITFSANKYLKQRSTVRKEVYKASPLTSVVHPLKSLEPSSRADRLVNLMDKMEEKKRNTQEPLMTPFRRRPPPGIPEPSVANESIFVYPSIDASKRRRSSDLHGILGRRSSFGSPARGPHLTMSQMAPSSVAGRRLSSLSVASMLLQTPPISRRRQSSGRHNISLNIQTPQSILKVKKLFQRDGSRSPTLSVISQASSQVSASVTKSAKFAKDDPDMDDESYNAMNDEIKHEIPTVSTPSAKAIERFGMKKFLARTKEELPTVKEQKPSVFDTPKRLRFAGLDSSANDSGLSAVLSPPIEQVAGLPNLTPVQIKAVDSNDENEMEVDITGDESEGEKEEKKDEDSPVKNETDFSDQVKAEDQDVSPNENVNSEPSENVNLEHIEISEDEEAVISGESGDEELDTSDEKFIDDKPFEQPLFTGLPQVDDEVICLDSSSEEENDEEAEISLPDKVDIEETLLRKQDPEEILGEVLEEKEELGYGSEEFSVEVFGESENLPIAHQIDENAEVQDDVLVSDNEKADDQGVQKIAPEDEDDIIPPATIGKNINEFESTAHQELESTPIQEDVLEAKSEAVKTSEMREDLDAQCVEVDVHVETSEDANPDKEKVIPSNVADQCLETPESEQIQLFISDDEDEVLEEPNENIAISEKREDITINQQDENQDLKLHLTSSEEDAFDEEEGVVKEKFNVSSTQVLAIEEPQDEVTSDYQSMSTTKIEEDVADHEQDGEKPCMQEKNADNILIKADTLAQETGTKSTEVVSVDVVTENLPEKLETRVSEKEKIAEMDVIESKPAEVVSRVQIVINPSTPVMDRMKKDPTFVLSPPTTRRSKRKVTKSTQYTPKPEPASESKVPKSPARVTRRMSKQSAQDTPAPAQEPAFLFSPPKTRKRPSRRANQSVVVDPDRSTVNLSPPLSTKKRTRSTTKSLDVDSDQSAKTPSPVRRSTRKTKSQSTADVETTPEQKPAATTPSRKTRQSPGRKPPATPTRSSSRVKAKLNLAKEAEKTPESETQLTDEPIATSATAKRTRRRKTSASSDVKSSDSEAPATPSRRSTRQSTAKAGAWSPSQDKTKLIELTPLAEEDEGEEKSKVKKRKKAKEETSQVSSRSSRSSTYATRTRRKAKIFTLEQQ